MISAYIVALAIQAVLPPEAVASAEHLIFQFPDGARGGTGNIQGTAEPVRCQPLGCILKGDSKIKLLKNCGLKDVRQAREVTHSVIFYGRSTRNDAAIVQCTKDATFAHFFVGYGDIDSNGIARIRNERAFESFWNNRLGQVRP